MSFLAKIDQSHQARLNTLESNKHHVTNHGHLTDIKTNTASTNTKLDTFSGHANNNVGMGATKLQVFPYAHNATADHMQPLKVDSNGALECSLNAIAGSEMQVDVVSSALPSGAATESTLQTIAEFNCDTTDVTITSLVPGVAATSLGKAIQSAQGATDTGVATLAVRNDTLADLAGADHDYAPLQVDASGALYTTNLATNLAITGTNNILTTIDEDTNAIKTSVQLLDNAVDGNYLNINQNIAGTDVDSNSGNKSAATQRVVIATDDINLAAIKTSVELIDNAMHTGVIPSSALNVSVATSVLPSGAATDNSILSMRVRDDEATVNGQYLMGTSAVVRQDTLASLVGTSGDNTQMSVDANGALYCINSATDALLTTIDADTNDIKTSVQALDNAVDGNYLNVNQNIAGTDVDSNSGNKSAATQRVVIATDDIPIALVNTKLDHLSDNLDVLETSANAIQSAVEGTLTVGSHAVTNVGTFAVQSDVTSISAGSNRIGMVGLKANEAADGSGTERHVLCDAAGHLQIDVVASALPSGAATESSLSSVDGKIRQGYDTQIASGGDGLQQNLVYGRDNSGNLDALRTDSSGHLEVVVDDFHKGQAAMSASFPVVIASDQSSVTVDNAVLTSLNGAINSNRVDVNIAAGGFDGAVTNDGLTALDAAINSDKVDVNISSGGFDGVVSGTVTANLSTTDNAVLDEIQTNGDNIQTKLDTIDSQIDLLEGANTIKDVSWLSSVSLSASSLSANLDTEGYKELTLYGKTISNHASNLHIFGSSGDGVYYHISNLRTSTVSGAYYIKEDNPLDLPNPRYLKIYNADTSTAIITLRATLTDKRRYV